MLDWFRQMLSGDVTMSEGTVRHFINTHVIRVTPDGLSARSKSHLQAVDTVSMATLAVGFVEAEHVRSEQGWRIRRYRVEERITDRDMEAFKAVLGLEYEVGLGSSRMVEPTSAEAAGGVAGPLPQEAGGASPSSPTGVIR